MNGISFFHPLFLRGLAFLAVPLIIHLFNRKRTVILRFSSIRFFRVTAVKANRARNIRRWLQLLARTLFIAALVLVFSRPYDRANPFSILNDSYTPVYFWVDPTISMEYRGNGVSRFEEARALIDSLARNVISGGRIFCFDDRERRFVPYRDAHEWFQRGVRHGGNLFQEAPAALDAHAGEKVPVMVIISDFQTQTAQDVNRYLGGNKVACPTVCVPVTPGKVWNYSVSSSVVAPGAPGVLRAVVGANGRNLDNGNVYARIGEMRAGHAAVSVRDRETRIVHLEIPADRAGSGGSVVLDADDPFLPDNENYFVSRRGEPSSILVVGEPRESYPIVAALGAAGAGRGRPVESKRPNELTAVDVDNARVIVLNGIDGLPPVLQGVTGARSMNGKAIIAALEPRAAAMTFNAMIVRELGGTGRVAPDSSRTGVSPVLADTLSMIWREFPRLVDRDAVIYDYMTGLPGEPLAYLDNEKRFITRAAAAGGLTVFLVATPLGITNANNLCETGFYLPLLDRLVRHALAMLPGEDDAWAAGVPRRNPYFGTRVRAKVYDSDNMLTATWENQQTVLFERPGLYRIQPEGEASRLVSVNCDSAETVLEYGGIDIPEKHRHGVRVVRSGDFIAFIGNRGAASFVSWLWIVCGLLVLVEVLLWQKPYAPVSQK